METRKATRFVHELFCLVRKELLSERDGNYVGIKPTFSQNFVNVRKELLSERDGNASEV